MSSNRNADCGTSAATSASAPGRELAQVDAVVRHRTRRRGRPAARAASRASTCPSRSARRRRRCGPAATEKVTSCEHRRVAVGERDAPHVDRRRAAVRAAAAPAPCSWLPSAVSTRCTRSQPTTLRGSSLSTQPIARTGKASSVNRYATRTSWPASMAPLPTRAVPTSRTTSTPSVGSASMTGSNRPRTRPTRTRVSRSSCARSRNRAVSSASRPSVLTTSAPSKLSWATPRHLAAQLLRAGHERRHPAAVDDGERRDGREDDGADEREHRVGDEQQPERDDEHEDDAHRERERRDRRPGRLDVGVGVGQQLAGRVLLVPGERQLQVAAGDPAAVRRLQPVLHQAGAEPAGHDADDLEHRGHHDGQEGQAEGGGRGVAPLDRRHDDAVGDGAEHVRLADRRQREQPAAHGGDREDPRLLPDGDPEHAEAAAEHARGRRGAGAGRGGRGQGSPGQRGRGRTPQETTPAGPPLFPCSRPSGVPRCGMPSPAAAERAALVDLLEQVGPDAPPCAAAGPPTTSPHTSSSATGRPSRCPAWSCRCCTRSPRRTSGAPAPARTPTSSGPCGPGRRCSPWAGSATPPSCTVVRARRGHRRPARQGPARPARRCRTRSGRGLSSPARRSPSRARARPGAALPRRPAPPGPAGARRGRAARRAGRADAVAVRPARHRRVRLEGSAEAVERARRARVGV